MQNPANPPSKFAIAAGLATIYLVWGSTYLAIRVAVESLPPFGMAGARFLLAGMILALLVQWKTGFSATLRQWRDNAIIGALLLLGGNGLVAWAEQDVPSGMATLVVSLNPLIIVLGDWLLYRFSANRSRGSQPNWLTFVGLFMGLLGLAILVGPAITTDGSERLEPARVAALVIACFFWCGGSLFTRYASDPVEPFTGAAMQMLCGGLWLLITSYLLGEIHTFSPTSTPPKAIAAWLYLVVFGSLIAFTTYIWLMKHVSPAIVATGSYVNPIVAVFLGWLLLNEPLSPQIFAGAATIVGSIITISVSKKWERKRT